MSLKAGTELFSTGQFFEAHDAWEESWQEMSGQERVFWQGMIQLAVSLYHSDNGNFSGARSLAGKSSDKFKSPNSLQSVSDREQLIHFLESWISALDSGDGSLIESTRSQLQTSIPIFLKHTGFLST